MCGLSRNQPLLPVLIVAIELVLGSVGLMNGITLRDEAEEKLRSLLKTNLGMEIAEMFSAAKAGLDSSHLCEINNSMEHQMLEK